jgi:amino acid transporter
VVALGSVSFAVSVVVEVVGGTGWEVLVAVGAAFEGMIYAVAAFCVLRLRGRLPDHHRPFRIPLVRLVAVVGLAVFGVMALVASVTVSNRFDPVPLLIIALLGGASALYTVRVVPKLRAEEEARRAARPARRPPRPSGGPTVPPGGPPGRSAAERQAPSVP